MKCPDRESENCKAMYLLYIRQPFVWVTCHFRHSCFVRIDKNSMMPWIQRILREETSLLFLFKERNHQGFCIPGISFLNKLINVCAYKFDLTVGLHTVLGSSHQSTNCMLSYSFCVKLPWNWDEGSIPFLDSNWVYLFIFVYEITSDIPHMFTIKVQVIRNTAHRPSMQASYTIGSGTTMQGNQPAAQIAAS